MHMHEQPVVIGRRQVARRQDEDANARAPRRLSLDPQPLTNN
jgi:hypothetical protein